MRKRLVASHRMGVTNFIRTEWDDTKKEFVKKVFNYPLGRPGYGQDDSTGSAYYGDTYEVPYANFNKADKYPHDRDAGKGLPGHGEAPTGYVEATGPISPITKRKVVGLALFPEAVALTQEYSNIITDTGKTRGKFTEIAWDIKYDAHVIPQLAAGIIPIVSIDDDVDYAVPVSLQGGGNMTVEPKAGSIFETETKITNDSTEPITTTGTTEVTNSATNPVNVKEI